MWILSVFRENIHVPWILSSFCLYIIISWRLYAFCGNIHVPWILSALCPFYLSRPVYPLLHDALPILNRLSGTLLSGQRKGSYLGKRVCHSEDGPTEMDPIVTVFGIIGQGGYWAISRGSHTQNIIQGSENMIRRDVITNVLKNSGELTIECDSFPFNPLRVETLMVSYLDEPFLASNENVRSASIIGASRPEQSRIITPGTNEDIPSRDDVQSTV